MLVEYKAQHGNTEVPKIYDQNPQLGDWAQTQRMKFSSNELMSNHILRLESIGFTWSSLRSKKQLKSWESMFQSLIEYKELYGNTLVPKKYDKNPKLGTWVQTQRRSHSKNKLLSKHLTRLESIGFCIEAVRK
mmetsp:Transcript_8343/g.16515  ORF Transcript_8343/g.16515 Transcript_8343/m.16515 type:complete len:133 (+) Transcript_8343:1-399(+)